MWDISSRFQEIFTDFEKRLGFEKKIKWSYVFLISAVHIFGVYWPYHHAFPVKWQTLLFTVFMYGISAIGVVVGMHRYWTHRSFKATLPLQVLLLIMFAITGQSSIRSWARNHRLHHKVSDTVLDPHDSSRGLFYSHVGWLMMKKTAQQIQYGRKIDISDLENDPLVMWYERNMIPVNILLAFVLPTVAKLWLLGETWRCAMAWQCCVRYLCVLHAQFTVNSLAHKHGSRPYNKSIQPANNWLVSLVTYGEGTHNYHHTFPFDYRGGPGTQPWTSLSTAFIRGCARIGWAYDQQEASPQMISAVVKRTG